MEKRPSLARTEEYDFFLKCAVAYDRIGCPALSMQLITGYHLDEIENLKLSSDENPNNTLGVDITNSSVDNSFLEPKHIAAKLFDEEQPKKSNFDWEEMEGSCGLDFREMPSSFEHDFVQTDTEKIQIEDSFESLNSTAKTFERNEPIHRSPSLIVPQFQYDVIMVERLCVKAFLLLNTVKLVQVL